MSANEIINGAIKQVGIKKYEAAALLGWSSTKINNKMMRNSVTADELVELMKAIGVKMVLTVKESGENYDVSNIYPCDDYCKKVINKAISKFGLMKFRIAENLGWSPQRLNNKLKTGTVTADEFIRIMDIIGIEVAFEVVSTGKKVIARKKGYGRPVTGMVDKEVYSTTSSIPIANNFYADGVNEYNCGRAAELYLADNGKYFFAEYSEYESVKDSISSVSAEDAMKFIETYGTNLQKGPKKEEE